MIICGMTSALARLSMESDMKILRLTAAALALILVAACSSTDDDTGATTGNANPSADAGGISSGAMDAAGKQATGLSLENQVGDTILFGYDHSDISPEAKRAILQRQAGFAQKYAALTFTIEGHCDQRGTREYNLALGERRADAAKTALVTLGIQDARLQTISYGKERPVAVGSSDAAAARNRRAVTVID